MQSRRIVSTLSVAVIAAVVFVSACSPAPTPTATARPATSVPTIEATAELTAEATMEMTAEVTAEATMEMTAEVTAEATMEMTAEVTAEATSVPPTERPTTVPSATAVPTERPTTVPSPTAVPTKRPTTVPTVVPPTVRPTNTATPIPSSTPAPMVEVTAEATAAVVECTLLDLNTATTSELMSAIRTISSIKARELGKYKPYTSIEEFDTEIGKTTNAAQIAIYKQFVYVPVDVNTSDAATLQQIVGVDADFAETLIAARPYANNVAFLTALSKSLTPDEVTAASCLLAD